MDNIEIKHMTLEELLKTIDSFLIFMQMDVTNITMKQRRKLLKEAIYRLQCDNSYVEYCLSTCVTQEKGAELVKRMNATNMVIQEIKQYMQFLPVENQKPFIKKICNHKKENL